MKIGEIEVQRIPPSQSIQCVNECSAKAVAYFNGIPLCPECLHEEQQLKWNEEGQFFVNSEGERVYYEVVRKLQ